MILYLKSGIIILPVAVSILPSICFIIDIPELVESSWYTGKEAVFEPSSPPRHVVELYDIVTSQNLQMKPIMFMYTDGGPDHKLTYLSVPLALVLLFLKLDLDFLCLPYRSISFVEKPSGKNNVHFEF